MRFREAVGAALRRRRLAQGRTLRQVADAAGMSLTYLSEVERGRKEASSEVLEAACAALGLVLADLLFEVAASLAAAEVEVATGRAVGFLPPALPVPAPTPTAPIAPVLDLRAFAARRTA